MLPIRFVCLRLSQPLVWTGVLAALLTIQPALAQDAGGAAPSNVPAAASAPDKDASDKEANELKARFPTADIAVREVEPGKGVYSMNVLKPGVEIMRMDVDPQRGFVLSNAPAYCDKHAVFLGAMTIYVSSATSDERSQIINAAAPSYDPGKPDNPPLEGLGVIPLNASCIVDSDVAKSGWINWVATLSYDDAGQTKKIRLTDITFWVNRGGRNWLDFRFGGARELLPDGSLGADVPVTAKLVRKGANATVEIDMANGRMFAPALKDLETLEFAEIHAPPPAANPAPTTHHRRHH